MNGAHDMGGVQGFGPVDAEVNEPVFHADWEKIVFAMTLAAGSMGIRFNQRERNVGVCAGGR